MSIDKNTIIELIRILEMTRGLLAVEMIDCVRRSKEDAIACENASQRVEHLLDRLRSVST